MPRFIFQARDMAGGTDSGAIVAADANEASHMLRSDGKIVISLQEESAASQLAAPRPRKIKRDDIIYFSMQLAVMVDTGVPLPEALDSIAEQTEHTGLRKMIDDISEQVKGGMEFSAALERYPRQFSKLFVALMRASEASGTMGRMLQRVSEYMRQEREIRKKIKGAMTYPAAMLCFCVLVVVALLVFVLPRFEKIYAGKGAVLPLPTRILLMASNGLVTYWPFIIVGVAGAAVGAYMYLKTPAGRDLMDKVRVNMPVLGQMYRKAYLARSLRTMSTMVSTGVSILDGLEITANAAGNACYARVWRTVSNSVREGATLSEELMEHPLIPRTVTQMISAGEKTGQLSNVMDRVAEFCEEDLNTAVKTITNMVEPAMIIIMGLIVGGIAMALLLPVFSMSKVVAN